MAPPTTVRLCGQCERPFNARLDGIRRGYGRYCSTACHRLARFGTLSDRFWRQVQRSEQCWLWTGQTAPSGYGRIVDTTAHRVSWELHYGPIPAGKHVCHHCDTPGCVRPDHLFLGSRSDNMRDMVAKGRHYQHTHPETVAKGSQNGHARLTEEAVREIRRLAGTVTQRALAARFGVSQRAVLFVIHGQTWRHVM